VITIRPATTADAAAIATVRADSWRAAYEGLLPAATLAEATGPASVSAYIQNLITRSCTGILVAEPPHQDHQDKQSQPGQQDPAGPDGRPLIGFASFGPERDAAGQPGPAPEASPPGTTPAELYAIYVAPAYWSGQAGWRLLTEVVNSAIAQRYASLSLWVLEANRRARRFYERGGFAVTGESQVMDDLGGVTEIRYWRPLTG
jgi:ribosomal protein S18 acetylase RimI-like enzyme